MIEVGTTVLLNHHYAPYLYRRNIDIENRFRGKVLRIHSADYVYDGEWQSGWYVYHLAHNGTRITNEPVGGWALNLAGNHVVLEECDARQV